MLRVVNSILFYYYFNLLAVIVYPFILVKSLFANNDLDFFSSLFKFLITILPLLFFFGVLCIKYNFIFSGYLLVFYFGGYLFYIYFKENNVEIDFESVLLVLSILTIIEALAINTIILPSDLPNWPLSAEDTILYGHTSRGGIHFGDFYYIRPIGFGGNSSITASLLLSIMIFNQNNQNNESLIKRLTSIFAILVLYSGVGYIFLCVYFAVLLKNFYVPILILASILLFGTFANIQKLDYEYFQFIIGDIFYNTLWILQSINIQEFFFGQLIPFESPIGGDFYWLYFFQWFGILGVIFYFLIIMSNSNRVNFLPIMLLVISSLHYHTIFSVPGQMIFGYLLAGANIDKIKPT
tara:strand:+ start:3969 stop:5024 length:1056 start_codon:yes stop_codon:yes gene_type:complete